jgi:hypothetical protein
MIRNEAANCGNCPYWVCWDNESMSDAGSCRVGPPVGEEPWPTTARPKWCGQHPDINLRGQDGGLNNDQS